MAEENRPQRANRHELPFRLLVVDDDLNLGESLRDVLTDKGYEVVVVTQGTTALDFLAREHFDMALVDIRMPGLDGAATAKLIHALRPGLPVAMITGYELDDLARQALEEGAVAILKKPLDIEHTVELIEHTVKRPTVLVVDPDRPEATELRRALESANCLTTIAPNLPAAHQALREATYDVVILDSSLMREQGPDALVDITRLQPGAYLVFVRPPLPVEAERPVDVPQESPQQRILEAQIRHAAFAVLDKPASPREVLRVVQRVKELIKQKDIEH